MPAAAPFQAPMSVRSSARRLVEQLLPWYDPAAETIRNVKTEAVRQRAIRQRVHVERVIDQYREADDRARVHAETIIRHYRRADDDRGRG
jgi:hypothetical protein